MNLPQNRMRPHNTIIEIIERTILPNSLQIASISKFFHFRFNLRSHERQALPLAQSVNEAGWTHTHIGLRVLLEKLAYCDKVHYFP